MTRGSVEIEAPPDEVRRRMGPTAESWAGRWTGAGDFSGRVEIPAIAGVRVGWLALDVEILPDPPDGSRVEWRVAEERWQVQGTLVVILLLAALGAMTVVIAPFVPKLMPLVPLGIMLGIGAWLFVLARLRNAGPEEFFDQLAVADPDETSGTG